MDGTVDSCNSKRVRPLEYLLLGSAIAAVVHGCSSSDAGVENGEPRPFDAGAPADGGAGVEIPFDEQEQAGWALVDVSILLPLKSALWPASAAARGGALLPSSLGLPRFTLPRDYATSEAEHAALRVVAVRLDPCFREGASTEPASGGCASQVRLVLQPLEAKASPGAIDAAIHAFYEVPEDQLRAMAERLRAARVASRIRVDRAALTVHPVLEREPAGALFRQLEHELLSHLGPDNLTRVTVLALRDRVNTWDFESFAVQGSALVPMPLPFVAGDGARQTLTSNGMGGLMQLRLSPESTAPDSLHPVYDAQIDVDPALGETALGRARRIEDPRVHRQGTVDCVNCHVAANVRIYLESRGAQSSQEGFRSEISFEVEDSAFVDTGRVHMFSYRGKVPLIAPRVVHETVQVLEHWR